MSKGLKILQILILTGASKILSKFCPKLSFKLLSDFEMDSDFGESSVVVFKSSSTHSQKQLPMGIARLSEHRFSS